MVETKEQAQQTVTMSINELIFIQLRDLKEGQRDLNRRMDRIENRMDRLEKKLMISSIDSKTKSTKTAKNSTPALISLPTKWIRRPIKGKSPPYRQSE